MNPSFETLNRIIAQRRSVFPESYTNQEIPREALAAILASANYAPTHKLTEPWRFVVFRSAGKTRFGAELARLYRASVTDAQFLQKKYDSILEKAARANVMVALNISYHPDKVPQWEEVAAMGCAVQNMALTAESLQIGAYWSSPAMIGELGPFLELGANEQCLGIFYMGYHEAAPREARRGPIEEKVRWIEE
ncbi:nitroreductase [Pedobacter yulinensis]|uniref:Nitroreductase n=1 Tax=Pedobacter yulinensis TaxID=2126353 RepID=A0A2T3HI44_9SPHI|nr:nitroreductase [Pedobacter yulinensis]PST82115.1 nitroreductase [Pedobacter yulinensis]